MGSLRDRIPSALNLRVGLHAASGTAIRYVITAPRDEADRFLVERRHDLRHEQVRAPRREEHGAFSNRRQLLGRCHVVAFADDPGESLLPQTGDTDLFLVV